MPPDPKYVCDVTLSTDGTDWWACLSDETGVLTTVRGASATEALDKAARIADRHAAGKAAA